MLLKALYSRRGFLFSVLAITFAAAVMSVLFFSNQITLAADPLAALSDDFNDGVISGDWQVHLPGKFQQSEQGGYFSLIPYPQTVWYNEAEAGFVYKNVSGNFKMTVRLQPRKVGTSSSPFSDSVQYAGIMFRDPSSDVTGIQNYVFNLVGYNQIEAKTTVNDVSSVFQTYHPTTQVELRLCRVGNTFYTYHRAIGSSTWTQYQTFVRSDIGAQVQAGMTTYAALSTADIEGRFDSAIFASANSAADCAVDTPTGSTNTPAPTASSTPSPLPSSTPVATSTSVPPGTATPQPSSTSSPVPSPTFTATSTGAPTSSAQTLFASNSAITVGSLVSGNLSSLSSNDNNFLAVRSATTGSNRISSLALTFSGIADTTPSSLNLTYIGKSDGAGRTFGLYLYNQNTGAWDQIDSFAVGTGEVTRSVTVSQNPERYINGANGTLQLGVVAGMAGQMTNTASHEQVTLVVVG